MQVQDRTSYIKEAIATFMRISGKTVTNLDATGDRVKAIEMVIDLLEEKGLMDELMETVKD